MVAELPAYPALAERRIASAQRTIDYQSEINLATERDHPALIRSATRATPSHSLRWWETWAACGSSLDTLGLLAAAADPMIARRAAAIKAVYWPWAGALHILLDCLADRAEDIATSQPNLLDLYSSPPEIAKRLEFLTIEAVRHATAVGINHRLVLAEMVSLYISDPKAWVPASRAAAECARRPQHTRVDGPTSAALCAP